VPRFSPRAPAHDPLTARLVTRAERGIATGEIERAATALRDEPGLLRASLRALLLGNAALEAVRPRSYVHANGFAKVILHAGDGWSIRLHVWPPGGHVEDVNPHGHRWVFASWIVTGVLRETTFAESSQGERFERCDYGRDVHGTAFLRVRGSARLVALEEIERSAGTVYARSRSVLHTAEPQGDDLVASLVVQGRTAFTPTPVYLRPGTPAEYREQVLRTDELRSLLAAVSDAIP
jgi:hypothetical protein